MQSFPRSRLRRWTAWALSALLSAAVHAAPVALPGFNADIAETSVSGLSSGGFMAVQFSVAHSSIMKGAGIIAGGPYYCAQGDLDIATRTCTCTGISFFSSCSPVPGATGVDRLTNFTEQQAREGKIDPTSHLRTQRIWMFSGTLDSVVPPPVMGDLYAYYRKYVDAGAIAFRNDIKAEHAFPTDGFGSACTKLGTPYINNCGIDAAGELLKWIYGPEFKPRNGQALSGRLIQFDQSEFFSDRKPTEHGMDNTGYVYVPANCDKSAGQRCRVHVAFHGCKQNAEMIDDKFVRHAGYNAWADANNIIVLYPQTHSKFGTNPNACWDWFDFDADDPDYANKNGRQIRAVKAMVDRVAGLTAPPVFSAGCFTASNAVHVLAGRAHDRFFFALANGSNEVLGLDNTFSVTSLKQTGPNFYVSGKCP
jgi:hypothetical protein